jgi:hypothetical protein
MLPVALLVCRWCTDHSAVPVLLVPPSVVDNGAPSNSIVVAGAGNMEGLHTAFDFAVRPLSSWFLVQQSSG